MATFTYRYACVAAPTTIVYETCSCVESAPTVCINHPGQAIITDTLSIVNSNYKNYDVLAKKLQILDTSLDNIYNINVSELTSDRNITLPLLTSNDTFVFANHAETLKSKLLEDSTTFIIDSSDATKRIAFNAAGSTGTTTTILSSATTDRTLTLPDATDTLVGVATSATLTNKTVSTGSTWSGNVIGVTVGGTGAATHTSGNVLVGAGTSAVTSTKAAPTGDFVGTTDTQTLTNKTVSTGSTWSGNVIGVAVGGTGAATHTSGNVLVGAGTSAVTSTKAAPTGAFVGTTDTQTLTNKTITGTTNTVRATQLATTGSDVVVSSSSAPAGAGYVLTTTGATAASWQIPTLDDVATLQARRTASLTISSTSYSNIAFDVTDVQSDATAISHNSVTNNDRIVIGETAYYQIGYGFSFDPDNTSTATSADDAVLTRVVINGTTEINGSLTQSGNHYSGSEVRGEFFHVQHYFITQLTSGQYISVQAAISRQGAGTTSRFISTQPGTITVVQLRGPKGDVGPIGPNGDVYAAVQARANNGQSIGTSYTTILFQNTDIETQPTIVEHNNTTTSRIDIKATGMYKVYYRVVVVSSAGTFHDAQARLLVNGVTQIPGSYSVGSSYGTVVSSNIQSQATASVIYNFTANDYVELQALFETADAATVAFDPVLIVEKAAGAFPGQDGTAGDITWEGNWVSGNYITNQAVSYNGSSYVCHTNTTASQLPTDTGFWNVLAAKGDTGAAGGNTVIVQSSGVAVTGTPHTTINFSTGITATNAGSGVVTISSSGTTSLVYQSSAYDGNTPSPFTTTSTSYVTATSASFSTGSLASGDYVVQWFAEFCSDSTDRSAGFRLFHNSTNVITEQVNSSKINGSTITWVGAGGTRHLGTISGVQTFAFQIYALSDTAQIRRTRIFVWRV